MRFPLAALFFLISAFIFFILWRVGSLLIDTTYDAMEPLSEGLPAGYASLIALLPTAFGIICAIFFVTGILLIFVLDSLADEPETYYRQ